jgi:hypothetical protein
MEFFYAETTITVGDGHTSSFWHAPWLDGEKPKNIAPSIFAISKRKNFTLNKGLFQDFWIEKVETNDISTINQLIDFVGLWSLIKEVHLIEGSKDDITWKFTNFGEYTAASAYKAQSEGMVNYFMMEAVWKNWAPPKCKLFVWLILHNRVWTADRLQKRVWPNCENCQLCKREPKTASHNFLKCRYSLRIRNSIIQWLGLSSVDVFYWANHDTVKEWWMSFIYPNGTPRKSFATLLMLVMWEIWNEQNARVFCNVATLPSIVV